MAPKDGPVGVLFSPPPGYSMVEANEVVPTSAASELETTASAPGASKVGVRFRHEGAQIYWLADLETDQLEEHSAGASGTRLQTIWRGNLRQRLAYAKTHGTFEVPGLPAGERVNLYH